MKINRKELLGALELAGKVPAYKGGLPVFDNVLLRLGQDKLTVICSDYEVRMETTVPAQPSTGEELWECLVNRKLLIQTIKAMYDEEFRIEFSKAFVLHITGNETKIQLPGNTAAGFPEQKWEREKEEHIWGLSHDRLQRFLQQGRSYVASDELRPVMNGLYLYMNEEREIGACSTDAHRLYHGYEKVENYDIHPSPWCFNLPKGAFNLIEAGLKRSSVMEVHKSGLVVRFIFGRTIVYVMTIEGNFPNFRAVIPQKHQFATFWEVNKSDLLRAINLAAVTENKATQLIRFKAGDELMVRSQDIDYQLESEQVVKVEKQGNDVEIGLKSAFLRDLLKSIPTQRVKFSIADATRAVIIEPETEQGFLTLLMPMMINY